MNPKCRRILRAPLHYYEICVSILSRTSPPRSGGVTFPARAHFRSGAFGRPIPTCSPAPFHCDGSEIFRGRRSLVPPPEICPSGTIFFSLDILDFAHPWREGNPYRQCGMSNIPDRESPAYATSAHFSYRPSIQSARIRFFCLTIPPVPSVKKGSTFLSTRNGVSAFCSLHSLF